MDDEDVTPEPTGWAAFRATAPSNSIKADPELADLLEGYGSNLWAETRASCMTYLIKDSTVLNIVLSHRDIVDTSTWTNRQQWDYVNKLFRNFDPRVKKLFDLASTRIVNYPVWAVPPLRRWAHDSGKFVMLGDAAHAMAFYFSMGVSLAAEDAVALGETLRLAMSGDASRNKDADLKA